MIKKRKQYIYNVALSVGCVILAVLVGAQSFSYFRLKQRCIGAAEDKIRYHKEVMEKQDEIDSLNRQVEELSGQLEEKDRKIEKLTKRVNELKTRVQPEQPGSEANGEEIQGTISRSQGDSPFTDRSAAVGEIISEEEAYNNLDSYFQAYPIERESEVFARINGKSYVDNDNIALEDLRYLKMLHYNFSHEIQVGEMIVNVQLQEDVLSIFKELFQKGYEIQSMRLVDDYWSEGMDGNDADFASIEVNNTSAFNYRPVSGGGGLSDHAYGRAIDINPQQNPFVSGGNYSHANAAPYIDRTSGDPHVIVGNSSDDCYSAFEARGFSWGGFWENPIDYQHFYKK